MSAVFKPKSKLHVDQHPNSIALIQEQPSSNSSASTIVLGNDPVSTPLSSTNIPGAPDIKSSTLGAAVTTNGAEDLITVKQDNTSVTTRDQGSSAKVRC